MSHFISDEVSIAIKRGLKTSGLKELVALVETPPDPLRCQLVRNRLCDRLCETTNCVVCPYGRDGDCMSSYNDYGDEYIGETGRPLCIRIKEHLDGKRKARQGTPLGTHWIQKHSGDIFEVKINLNRFRHYDFNWGFSLTGFIADLCSPN